MVPNKCLGCYRVTTKSPEKNLEINFDIKINFDLVIAEGPSGSNLKLRLDQATGIFIYI